MGWEKREPVTDLVILGDSEGDRKRVGGLLIAMPRDKGYDKTNYQLVQQNGDVLTVSGSASIARQINEQDIGKFVKLTFTGWGKSPNGKFKAIEVNVWEGEATPEMRAWPQYGETKKNGKPPVAAKDGEIPSDFSDFDNAPPDDDDLPF